MHSDEFGKNRVRWRWVGHEQMNAWIYWCDKRRTTVSVKYGSVVPLKPGIPTYLTKYKGGLWNKSSVLLDQIEFRTRLNQFGMFEEHEKNVVLNENSVEGKPCINRESKSDEITIQLYSCHYINMNFIVVVTPPYIYHGFSTQKKFQEEIFTGKEDLFLSVNMKNCGCLKVRKHNEIKGSDNIVTLNVSERIEILNKMETTSSE